MVHGSTRNSSRTYEVLHDFLLCHRVWIRHHPTKLATCLIRKEGERLRLFTTVVYSMHIVASIQYLQDTIICLSVWIQWLFYRSIARRPQFRCRWGEQETDQHDCCVGDGEFNWRFVFSRVQVTKGVPIDCFLHLSVWDSRRWRFRLSDLLVWWDHIVLFGYWVATTQWFPVRHTVVVIRCGCCCSRGYYSGLWT